MEVCNLKDWTNIIQNVFTVIAIIVGGCWALRRYWYRREGVWNIEMMVKTLSIRSFSPGRVFVCLQVDMKNVGQVRFTPGKDGLSVSYQQIDMQSAVGVVEWDKSKIGEKSDVLKKYKDNQEEPTQFSRWFSFILRKFKHKPDNTYEKAYNLDPGACYVEEIYYILNEGQLYIFDITLYAQETDRLTYYHLVDTKLIANNI